MKIEKNEPPREFTVGFGPPVVMKDCAHIELEPDEQVTLKTETGAEYDVARKNWGFYATPSINGRLQKFGFRTALVRNRLNQFFVMLVEQGREEPFQEYLNDEGLTVCMWLDDQDTLESLAAKLGDSSSSSAA